jgi:AcrR family transcriptional regulator
VAISVTVAGSYYDQPLLDSLTAGARRYVRPHATLFLIVATIFRYAADVADEREGATTALRLARTKFMAGERLDSSRLAAELGVDRTTLFRWVGNRDQLLVAVLISLADPTLCSAEEAATGTGAERIGRVMRLFSQALIDAPYYRVFLQRETERAMRLITTKASALQLHVRAAVQRLLEQERDRGNLTPSMPLPDLAYLVVRIAESFIYSDLIVGCEPDAAKVELAVTALLHGSERTSRAGTPYGAPRPEPTTDAHD